MPTIVGWVYRMGVVAGLSVGVAITLPAPTSGDWVASRVADDGVALATVGQVGGAVYAVAADGSYAYAGIGPRLVAIDVSDPLHPLEVGRTEPSPWLVQGVAVADGYAYAVGSESAYFAGDGGMRIVAISDPTTPREVGVLATDWPHAPAWPEGVVAKDGYVYVALANAGLRVVDASDPRQPCEVAQYQPGGAVWSVATAGDVLAAAVCGSAPDEPRGLFLLDIADAGQPRELARLSMQDCPSAVALADHYAVVTSNRGVHVVDAADPARPREVGFLDTVHSDDAESPYEVAISAGLAYIVTFDGHWSALRVVDIHDATRPELIGDAAPVGRVVRSLALGAGALLLAVAPDLDGGAGGLDVFDAAEATSPREVAWIGALAQPSTVAVQGNRVIAGDWYGGLWVIDATHADSPRSLGVARTWPMVSDIAITGDQAYVAAASVVAPQWGLQRVDVSDPAAPRVQAEASLSGSASPLNMHVAVAGRYAYVSALPTGLLSVVDLSADDQFGEIAALTAPGAPYGLDVVGEYVYVGIESVKETPDVPAATPTPRACSAAPSHGSVGTSGSAATDSAGGLWIVDVADPAKPRSIAVVGGPDAVHDVAAIGPTTLAVCGLEGLRILDVADPLQPREIGRFGGGSVSHVTVVGDRLFGIGTTYYDPERGYDVPTVWVLDISEPTAPIALGRLYRDARDVAVAGDLVLVAAGDYGLEVLQVSAGPRPATPTPGPSPTRRPSPTPAATATGTAQPTPTAYRAENAYLPMVRIDAAP